MTQTPVASLIRWLLTVSCDCCESVHAAFFANKLELFQPALRLLPVTPAVSRSELSSAVSSRPLHRCLTVSVQFSPRVFCCLYILTCLLKEVTWSSDSLLLGSLTYGHLNITSLLLLAGLPHWCWTVWLRNISHCSAFREDEIKFDVTTIQLIWSHIN